MKKQVKSNADVNLVSPADKAPDVQAINLSNVASAVSATFSDGRKSISLGTPSVGALTMPEGLPDFESLKIGIGYGEEVAIHKPLVTVPVGKPKGNKFMMVLDVPGYPTNVLDIKEDNDVFIVSPAVAAYLGGLVRKVTLYTAIDRNGNIFLIPVPNPDETGHMNVWHESLLQGVNRAKKNWVRLVANKGLGAYDVLEALGILDKPTWPDYTMEQLLAVAFRGKIITDINHDVVQRLMGLK